MEEKKHSFVQCHVSAASEKLKDVARRDLGETDELKNESLQQLKILIRDHKVNCISTDDFLLRFLRTKKFNTQRSFEALRNYAYLRTLLHKSLLKLKPEVLETCIRQNIIGILPYRDAQERLISFFRGALWNPQICDVHDLLTVSFLVDNYVSENESTQISGTIAIFDLTSVPLTYAGHLIRIMWRFRDFVFNSLPARFASLHIISDSLVLKYLLPIITPFVPKKIINRMVFHEVAGERLFEEIPRRILPNEFGGTMEPLNSDQMTEIMMKYVQKLKDEHHHFQKDSENS